MSNLNKMLTDCIENEKLSSQDLYNVLNILNGISNYQKKIKKYANDKIFLKKELADIYKLHNNKNNKALYKHFEDQIRYNIYKICNNEEINVLKKIFDLKIQLHSIIIKYYSPLDTKSSVKKFEKRKEHLIYKQTKIQNEIKETNKELQIIKKYPIKFKNLEKYLNNLITTELPKIKKDILTQEYFIDLITKNKGR